jgi:replicative DNA helicase
VLGAVLIDPACLAKAAGILDTGDFYRPAHQTIWAGLAEMSNAGQACDLVTARAHFRDRGWLEQIGGVEYLVALAKGVPTSANVEYYARIVKDKSILRQIIVTCAELIEAAYEAGTDAAEAIRDAEQRLYNLAPSRALGRTLTVAEAAKRVIDRAERVAAGLEPAGLSLGWPDLDDASGGGLRPGQLVVIAAATSIGKSAIALRMAANVAAAGGAVKVFSVEMSADELGARLLAMHSGVDGLLIARGRVGEHDRGRLEKAQAEFARWGRNVELTDRPLTVPQMGAELRRMGHRLNRQIDLAVIDYLQIVPAHEGDNLRERINGITRAAKLMAQELRVPVLLLSQLSRTAQAERRAPELHDLKESSSIEQDADGVILLHRRPDALADAVSGNITIDAKIAKWRNGLTTQWGQLSLSFKRDTADFYFPRIACETATA